MGRHANPKKILIVDDDEGLSRVIRNVLKQQYYTVECAGTIEEMWAALERDQQEVILLDVHLPDGTGLSQISRLRSDFPDTAVILITAMGTISMAVDALHGGVFDFITKPIDSERLLESIRQAFRVVRKEACESPTVSGGATKADGAILGESRIIRKLRDDIGKVARSDCAVLITGESGTGKELVAQSLHRLSHRCANTLSVVNCAALPRELVESELFGHEKGAFTGASNVRVGYAERADKGTLFLDEIGEMPIDSQCKLLRFLEDGILMRVGGSKQVVVDARIVAATNRNARQLTERGLMREDLMYRISQVTLKVPSLRERKEDIPILAEAFLRRAASVEHRRFRNVDPEVMRILKQYHWPGNVRHLLNVITGIVVFHDAETVTKDMLPVDLLSSVEDQQAERSATEVVNERGTDNEECPFWKVEMTTIRDGLERHRGNVTELAAALQMSKATLYRRIKRYGLAVR